MKYEEGDIVMNVWSRKIVAYILLLMMSMVLVPFSALATNTDVVEISTAEELWEFAGKVNGGQTSLNAKLMDDIVFNENVLGADGYLNTGNYDVWKPIGTVEKSYSGTFDGNNKTISGLYFDDYQCDIGLFGVVKDGTIKNVKLTDSYFYGDAGVGGIVGSIENGTVTDCSSSAFLKSNSDNVGGIAGVCFGATIKNCSNSGSIDAGGSNIGGVVGSNFAGDSYPVGIVENCYNTATKVGGYGTIGGVVGLNEAYSDNAKSTVKKCYNVGWVDAFDSNAGGVVGQNNASSDNAKAIIEECYNQGKVSASGWHVAGVVAENYAWSETASATVKNCYSTGEFSENEESGGVAGISEGYNGCVLVKIENCYYLDDSKFVFGGIGGVDYLGSAEVKTTEEFESGEVAYLLGLSYGQNIDNGLTVQTAPVLDGAKVFSYLEGYSNHPYGFTLLDKTNKVVTVHVPEAGNYSVIFADYNSKKVLQKLAVIPLTATGEGDYKITENTSSMVIEEGDKIMLWDSLDNCTPLCNGYTLK